MKRHEHDLLIFAIVRIVGIIAITSLLLKVIDVISAIMGAGIPLIIPISFYFCRKKGAQGEDTDKK